jgi:hypothetical protein
MTERLLETTSLSPIALVEFITIPVASAECNHQQGSASLVRHFAVPRMSACLVSSCHIEPIAEDLSFCHLDTHLAHRCKKWI